MNKVKKITIHGRKNYFFAEGRPIILTATMNKTIITATTAQNIFELAKSAKMLEE